MDRLIIRYILQFVLLVLVQVLLLNNIAFSGILNPYLYVYFLIILPVDFRPTLGLIIGFLLGLSIDLFSQTLGMHTIATTFAAFCRPYILMYMAPRDGYDFTRFPSVRQMGWLWFGTYTTLLAALHHFILFFIEMFRMSGFWWTITKSVSSTMLTVILILLVQLIFVRDTRKTSGYE